MLLRRSRQSSKTPYSEASARFSDSEHLDKTPKEFRSQVKNYLARFIYPSGQLDRALGVEPIGSGVLADQLRVGRVRGNKDEPLYS